MDALRNDKWRVFVISQFEAELYTLAECHINQLLQAKNVTHTSISKKFVSVVTYYTFLHLSALLQQLAEHATLVKSTKIIFKNLQISLIKLHFLLFLNFKFDLFRTTKHQPHVQQKKNDLQRGGRRVVIVKDNAQ